MKITEVAITLEPPNDNVYLRINYHCISAYLTLYISDWIKKKKLDLGFFNRIVFTEYAPDFWDMRTAGERAYQVCLESEYKEMDIKNPHANHEYFTRKYLEGFNKIDKKFNLNLSRELEAVISIGFNDGFFYEYLLTSKVVHGLKRLVVGRYTCTEFNLIVRSVSKDNIISEEVIDRRTPNLMHIPHFLCKSEIKNDILKVYCSSGEIEIEYAFPKS
jgi:hypothetical protein